VALQFDDAGPPDLEQPLYERLVQVAVRERGLHDHRQIRAGRDDHARRATGDRRRHVVGGAAQQVRQNEYAALVVPDRRSNALGVVVRVDSSADGRAP
jgi:hypothetical protein